MRRNKALGLILACALILGVVLLRPAPSGAVDDLSEILWPRNPQVSATPMWDRACVDESEAGATPGPSHPCHQFDDFTRTDYEGWGDNGGAGNDANERTAWVADPTSSGKIVAQLTARPADDADHYGGTRDNIWLGNHDQDQGTQAFFSVGFLIPSGFDYLYGDPAGGDWLLLWQNHGGDDSEHPPPPQALELRDSNCELGYHTYRNTLCFKVQTVADDPNGDYTTYLNLGAVHSGSVNHENEWGYLTAKTVFDYSGNGQIRAWFRWGTRPDTDLTMYRFLNISGINTLYSTDDFHEGFPGFLVYRETHSPPLTNEHQTVLYCGFHRTSAAGLDDGVVPLPNCPAVA